MAEGSFEERIDAHVRRADEHFALMSSQMQEHTRAVDDVTVSLRQLTMLHARVVDHMVEHFGAGMRELSAATRMNTEDVRAHTKAILAMVDRLPPPNPA